jgi:hypothetical protein
MSEHEAAASLVPRPTDAVTLRPTPEYGPLVRAQSHRLSVNWCAT